MKDWRRGIDYPIWGDNELYKATIQGGYLQPGEKPVDAYKRISSRAAEILKRPDLEKDFFEAI